MLVVEKVLLTVGLMVGQMVNLLVDETVEGSAD
jgi:hypothetical protein